eukprot:1187915-Prorocentrum_minimum.AAC.1
MSQRAKVQPPPPKNDSCDRERLAQSSKSQLIVIVDRKCKKGAIHIRSYPISRTTGFFDKTSGAVCPQDVGPSAIGRERVDTAVEVNLRMTVAGLVMDPASREDVGLRASLFTLGPTAVGYRAPGDDTIERLQMLMKFVIAVNDQASHEEATIVISQHHPTTAPGVDVAKSLRFLVEAGVAKPGHDVLNLVCEQWSRLQIALKTGRTPGETVSLRTFNETLMTDTTPKKGPVDTGYSGSKLASQIAAATAKALAVLSSKRGRSPDSRPSAK